ncbi:MAG: hypothetical protein D6800_00730 [Candidatus Zixiibacteriota bacterium]|nr:MAG: hypothetical protein D6800_00730 [candidate division Zixibacteria bacterium]
MKYAKVLIVLTVPVLFLLMGCERTVTNEITKQVTPSTAAYVGSDVCQPCHTTIYDSFRKTGHPFKLNEAEDAQQAGYYPFTTIPSPPPGVAWSDVDKVIGGFWWKARFIDTSGFIITGDQVQYNLATGEWVAYHSGETKPYECGPCHMTNYKDVGNQEGKPGLIGTWTFNGIQCEECHGPGELHAADPFNVAMKIDNSSEACGKCHVRGDVEQIPASGGFIKHHEQWNELFRSKHNALDCVDCHDPHVGLHPNNPERESAIRVKCEKCHLKETESFKNSSINHYGSSAGPDCVDCHMAKAAKSAVAVGPYEGDIHSHSFKINTDPNAEMFSADGKTANGYLTLEYVCLTCHSSKDKQWAATYAGSIHAESPADSLTYVGSKACEACHPTTYANFMKTGHPFKLNEAEDVQQAGYYPFTTVPSPPPGYSWSDVDKVIGGFWWKARFIDTTGFIITGDSVQYNLANGSWSAYHSGEVKPYACGPCHMTNYKDVGNQEGKPGLVGTWTFNGIQCEECHGPGSAHIADAFTNKMKIDRSSEACGKCHVRGDNNAIPASGGFIRHHEQWNEMSTTKHRSLQCVDCHDPHMGLHPSNPDRASAIKMQCEDCHYQEAASFAATTITKHINNNLQCIDCHMPKAAKSALAVGTYEGDIHSHLWRINTDSTAEMFTPDGSLANGYLTLEFTCLRCHPTQTKGWAAQNAVNAHNAAVAKELEQQTISMR